MAFAQRRVRGLFDPDAPEGTSPFDHRVYVIASDGDLQEGVASEASSLAGTQELGNLIVFWDDNHISIEGDTDVAFTEDVIARYDAYGWHTQSVDWTAGGEYREDVDALAAAIEEAKKVTDRPSFIALRTIIAWPSPGKQGTGAAHGAKLGAEEVAGLKKAIGFDPEKHFDVDPAVLEHTRSVIARGAAAHLEWDRSFEEWAAANPERAALLQRLRAKELPESWASALPQIGRASCRESGWTWVHGVASRRTRVVR